MISVKTKYYSRVLKNLIRIINTAFSPAKVLTVAK